MKLETRHSKLTIALLVLALAGVVYATTTTFTYGTNNGLVITNLLSLASSATAGWQSALVDNRTVKALDYQVGIKLTMANTAPANDKAVYVYACPAYWADPNWYYADQGTTTLPTGSQGATTIASPNNLRLVAVLNYTTQAQIVQGTFNLGPALGYVMPDGFSLILVNFSGAAVAANGCVVAVKPITVNIQ